MHTEARVKWHSISFYRFPLMPDYLLGKKFAMLADIFFPNALRQSVDILKRNPLDQCLCWEYLAYYLVA